MTDTPKLTRRRFLERSAAALAAPLILPKLRLFGADAPSNRINLALIGCGARAGYVFLENLPIPGLRVVAAVDPFAGRRESYAARLNEKYETDACRPFRDFREIIARPDIDAVGVFTPDHWHVPVAWAAAQHRKDMYVEKPLSVALEWPWKLRPKMRESGVVFQYGTFQRSVSQFRRACELVRNGYIGNVQRVDVWCPSLPPDVHVPRREESVPEGFDYDLWTGPAPRRPYQPERVSSEGAWHCHETALGFIAGWGAHPLDICQWGLDMDATGPVRYAGRGVLPTAEDELYNTTRGWDIACDYANGVKMRFMDETTAMPVVQAYHYVFRDHGTVFHGDEGWVGVDRMAMYSSDHSRLRQVELADTDTPLPESPGHVENFLECMRTRAQTISPFEAALRCDTISHLSDIVVRTGRPLEWDPAAEQIVNATVEQNKRLGRPMRAGYAIE